MACTIGWQVYLSGNLEGGLPVDQPLKYRSMSFFEVAMLAGKSGRG